MITKKFFHSNDAYHLNIGVPIVLGMILFLINIEFFALRFLENISNIFSIYMYATFLFLTVVYFSSKKNKENKRIVLISLYDTLVYNSILVLIFLLINFNFSESIFKQQLPVGYGYDYLYTEKNIPDEYRPIFKLDHDEYEEYYGKGYDIYVQIDKSVFGYVFIKRRTFIETSR